MAELGIRPCDISRQLKVSHGCISKLLSKYNDTGSFEPGRAKRKTSRDVSSEVKNKIEEYRRATPGIFSWEVKEKLMADGYCTKESLPPLTVISRMLRRVKSTGSDYMEKSEGENSDAESEGDTSSTNSGDAGKPKPRPKRRSFSIANILSINEETRTVSLSPSTSSSSQEEPGKTGSFNENIRLLSTLPGDGNVIRKTTSNYYIGVTVQENLNLKGLISRSNP